MFFFRKSLLAMSLGLLCVNGISYADDDSLFFTPQGFKKPGVVKTATGNNDGFVRIIVRDAATKQPTCCRVNVIGPDGDYYQPRENYLSPFSLTGEWPKSGKGNRSGKGPFRYLGRFFYSWGDVTVQVPPGPVRVEVWKGLEYRPQQAAVNVEIGFTATVELALERPEPMEKYGYYSGDPHLHFARKGDADDDTILDLLEAEDVHFGSVLAYNEPAGPYQGFMKSMDSPQSRGLGIESLRSRGDYHIVSGQEYRSTTFGHLNLFLRKDLVLDGKSLNADSGPPYGTIARETKQQGGFAFYAHGGYAQSIYADAVQGDIDGVELLQFGVYRGIGLEDWYRFFNIGYRFPATGASDYPACRFLSDCRTYVYSEKKPDFKGWLEGCRAGRSFMTTGPLLFLEVEGQKPGAIIEKTGAGPYRVAVRARVFSTVTNDRQIEVVCNGQVTGSGGASSDVKESSAEQLGWSEFTTTLDLTKPSWIAARAYSKATDGRPDGEAHTNPVYVVIDGKAPYDRESLDKLVEKLDGQIAVQKKRDFGTKAEVIDYFERSRDILLKIREAGGVPATGHPADILKAELPTLKDPGARTHSDEDLKEYLKPLPSRTPKEALATFETVDGFRMELVASEPLVHSPVAAAFDEDGALYVCEMIDYPYFPKTGDKPLGTVRKLIDTDGDGVFDKSTIFADELLWAAGVAPWQGGVFVASPPDIWYLKDTNGDDTADVRRKVFTGFGTKNQQAMVNNLTFGLDHKIYGATAGNGGSIRPGDKPDAEPISVDGRDFRFDPVSEKFETLTGTIQFGNTFDDWGNRFVCSQASPVEHPVLPQEYLSRNPFLPVPRAIVNIGGSDVPIFRISPIEHWRNVRSSRRIAHNERGANSSGASHHVVDAAAGVTIYRGHAYPEQYYGTVFTGDAQNDLVYHTRLEPDGVTFRAVRVEQNTEFVRSSDNWFRPVNFVNAPDGTLYVLDMSREILESIHIPLDVLKFLDLKRGRDQGRIYRMASPGFRSPKPPQLSRATTVELVDLLEHPDGWYRDTAHRLLFERQDKSAVDAMKRLLRESKSPQGRLHALWSLQGLGSLDDEQILLALGDAAPVIREHALRLSEPRLDSSPKLLEKAVSLVDDESPRVRFQTAFSLGASRDERAVKAIARVARRDVKDSWMRTAVLSSITETAPNVLALWLADEEFAKSPEGQEMLAQAAYIVGARNRAEDIRAVLQTLAAHRHSSSEQAVERRMVQGMGDGLRQTGHHLAVPSTAGDASSADAYLRELLESTRAMSADEKMSEGDRCNAIRLLGCVEYSFAEDTLTKLIDPHAPLGVQLAAVSTLGNYKESAIAGKLLDRWKEFVPDVRSEVIRILLSRDAWAESLLGAIANETVPIAALDVGQRSLLLQHRNIALKELAGKLFGADALNLRKQVLADYESVLTLAGSAKAGEKIFERECMGCHKIGEKGHAIGPSLIASSFRDPKALLTNILDPNLYVLPNYVQYVLVDQEGRTYTGLVSNQSSTSVTLKRDKDASDTFLRSQIDEMASTGKSLMPEGLEKKITQQEMADLIAYITEAQASEPKVEPRLDIGTEPGLVEPER